VVAATAYDAAVNRRLEAFLKESGFEVLGVKGLGIEKVEEVDQVTEDGNAEILRERGRNAAGSQCNSGIVRRTSFRPWKSWRPWRAGLRNAALESLAACV
jgi:hypothetical protein